MENDAISRSAVYISLSDALDTIYNIDISDCTDIDDIVGRIYEAVGAIPDVDVAPVVRCKDCQYAIPLDGHAFRRWGNNALNCTECRGDDGFGMAGVSLAYHDGFCDRGVRRECEPHD